MTLQEFVNSLPYYETGGDDSPEAIKYRAFRPRNTSPEAVLRAFVKLVRERAESYHKDCDHDPEIWELQPHDFGNAFKEVVGDFGLED